jgi:hypothetical protein
VLVDSNEMQISFVTMKNNNRVCHNEEGDFLDKTTYGETSRTEEGPTYDIY